MPTSVNIPEAQPKLNPTLYRAYINSEVRVFSTSPHHSITLSVLHPRSRSVTCFPPLCPSLALSNSPHLPVAPPLPSLSVSLTLIGQIWRPEGRHRAWRLGYSSKSAAATAPPNPVRTRLDLARRSSDPVVLVLRRIWQGEAWICQGGGWIHGWEVRSSVDYLFFLPDGADQTTACTWRLDHGATAADQASRRCQAYRPIWASTFLFIFYLIYRGGNSNCLDKSNDYYDLLTVAVVISAW
jgi:hypothetical protein